MKLGYIPTFTSYENGELKFDIISDPRFNGNDFMLARFIASQYAQRVTLLKDATNFVASHFKANDIIGFLISKDEEHLLEGLQSRIDKSYSELPTKPALVHYGRVVIL